MKNRLEQRHPFPFMVVQNCPRGDNMRVHDSVSWGLRRTQSNDPAVVLIGTPAAQVSEGSAESGHQA